MKELMEILEDIQPDADYETCTTQKKGIELVRDTIPSSQLNRKRRK